MNNITNSLLCLLLFCSSLLAHDVDERQVKLLEEAQSKAVKGDVKAQLQLASKYAGWEVAGWNWPVKKSLPLAIHWSLKAADAGSAEAGFHLGYLYHERSVFQDDAKSLYWFNRSAEMGFATSQTFLGHRYGYSQPRHISDLPLSAKWFRKAADQGDPSGMFEYGYILKHGIGLVQDLNASLVWYLKAADAGESYAQHEVGVAYFKGIGALKDDIKALAYLQLACGNKESLYNHGDDEISTTEGRRIKAILEGRMPAGSRDSAISLAKEIQTKIEANKAADPEVASRLRRQQEVDFKEFKLYLARAEQGDAAAQFTVYTFLFNGIGSDEPDKLKAIEWLKKSAENGYPMAQFEMGDRFEHARDGFTLDKTKAARFYRMAAEQMDHGGLMLTARCYEHGIGVEKDEIEAFAYYALSLDLWDAGRADIARFEARMSVGARKTGQLRAKKLKDEIDAKISASKAKTVGK